MPNASWFAAYGPCLLLWMKSAARVTCNSGISPGHLRRSSNADLKRSQISRILNSGDRGQATSNHVCAVYTAGVGRDAIHQFRGRESQSPTVLGFSPFCQMDLFARACLDWDPRSPSTTQELSMSLDRRIIGIKPNFSVIIFFWLFSGGNLVDCR